MHVLVVGAGVAGLTAAIELAREGHGVSIRAAERTPDTTSDVAAAVWYPFLAEPREDVIRWSRVGYERLLEQADAAGAGVDVAPVVELFDEPPGEPWWLGAGPTPTACEPGELPADYEAGWRVEVPVLDMGRYLPWLEERARELGARIREGRVRDLARAARAADADLVANCTGLGARELVGDDELVPVRGHVVHVSNPGVERGWIDQSTERAIAYGVPVADRLVLGGTAHEGEEALAWPEGAAERILEVNRAVEPRIEGAEVLDRKVGLRPYRSPVRLEAERMADGTRVIHNYGHGGSGVTVAWGCAREVADRAEPA